MAEDNYDVIHCFWQASGATPMPTPSHSQGLHASPLVASMASGPPHFGSHVPPKDRGDFLKSMFPEGRAGRRA